MSGAHLFLYALATTDKGPAQSLLTTPGGYVVTDSGGNWSATGDYTCPANAYVYVLALGGNPGLAAGVNNSKLALASLLGDCASIDDAQFFVVNEITTVVAASALASLASSETQIGSANTTAAANAVTRNTTLIDPNAGTARTFTPDRTGSVPQAKINSLADSIASCVNSDGTGSVCKSLMDNSGLSSTSLPPDTFNAAILIAQNPAGDPYDIYTLSDSSAPFEPTLATAPPDWELTAQYSGGGGSTANGISMTPDSATISPGGQVAFAANGGGNGSYLWVTSGTLGTLTAPSVASGQTTFCINGSQVNYVSSGSSVQGATADTVKVTYYPAASCSGNAQGSATASVTTLPASSTTTYPNLPTGTYQATVVLPGGVHLRPDSLTVLNSISQTTPTGSGAFSLPQYTGGPQVVIVDGPDGTPMLLGWMDANHATVDESTTAEVLTFYALGGPAMLAASDRAAAIAQIPQLDGFSDLVSVVESELNANVDAFAQPNANLRAALNTLFTHTTGYATRARQGGARPQDILISPDASTPQSGVILTNVEPASSPNTITPFSTFLTNAYRRRTHYFVIRQKDTLNGKDTASGAQIADADVSATTGVNGGVTGALTDIIKAYFGNQPTAYAPVTSDPFDLPVDSGFDSTTYQVINVGAGASGARSPVPLTAAQHTILVTTAVNGFVSDALVPFINNVLIAGSDEAANTPLSGSSRSPFVLNLEKNIANIVSGISGEQDKLVAGDYKSAIEDLLFNAGTQPLVSDAIKSALTSAVPSTSVAGVKNVLGKFDGILNAAGAGLQVFDTAIYSAQLAGSDTVDVWTVTSTKFKLTLSPAATTLNKVGSVQLQATAVNVPSSAQLSYKWTIMPQSGQGFVGTLSEIGGAGRTLPDSSGNTSACSSSATWGYANSASTFQALTVPTTDSVTVTAYQGPNCVVAQVLTNDASATITNSANPQVSITPATSTLEAGGNVSLQAAFTDPKATTQPVPASWLWQLQGAAGTAYGTLGNSDGTVSASGASFCSTRNAVVYTSTESDPVTAAESDQVNATAYPQAGCQGSAMNRQPGTATVTTRSTPGFKLSPTHATLQAGATLQLSATFSSTDTAGFSYAWGTSGRIGSLTDTGGSGKTGLVGFCTSSNIITFVTDPNQTVKQPVSDFVTVAAYSGAGCVASNQFGQPQAAQLTLQPTPSVAASPTQLLGQMLASDGYAYAVGPYLAPAYTGELNFPALTLGDTIFRIQSDGTVKSVVSFTHNVYDNYHQQNTVVSDAISPLVEGPDDALYGLAAAGGNTDNLGYFYKYSLTTGTVTVLHIFSKGDGSFGADQYGNPLNIGALQGPMLLANDGNFYVGGSGGVVKLTPAGQVSIAYNAGVTSTYGPFVQGADENLYGTQQTFPVYDSNGDVATLGGMSLFSTSLGGSGFTPALLVSPVYLFSQGNTPLVAGSDGAFYGTLRGERPGFGACEMTAVKNSDPAKFVTCDYKIGAATIFRFDPHAGLSTIYTFNSLGDGTTPLVGLIAGPDGNLYGAASAGGDLDSECITFPTNDGLSIGEQVRYDSNGNKVYGPKGPYRVSDEGCGTIFRITPSGSYTKMYQFQNGTEGRLSLGLGVYSNGAPQMLANLALDSAGDVLGDSASTSGGYDFGHVKIFKLPLFDNGPIQMNLSQSAVPAGTSVTLTWNVSNAFSLSAQQCYAHGIQGTGGGSWTGRQTGVADSSGYHGSATVTPTAPGTYFYELTCGGTQSSVAALTVQ